MGVEREEEEEENVCVYVIVSMYRPQERMQCCMYSLMKNFAHHSEPKGAVLVRQGRRPPCGQLFGKAAPQVNDKSTWLAVAVSLTSWVIR